jgi:pyrroloquinoline quinone biosynthesis protein E
MLTGDATNADPVCSLSPHHDEVLRITQKAQRPYQEEDIRELVFRNPGNSKKIRAEKS